MAATAGLGPLPGETVDAVCRMLDLASLGRAAAVSKGLKDHVADEELKVAALVQPVLNAHRDMEAHLPDPRKAEACTTALHDVFGLHVWHGGTLEPGSLEARVRETAAMRILAVIETEDWVDAYDHVAFIASKCISANLMGGLRAALLARRVYQTPPLAYMGDINAFSNLLDVAVAAQSGSSLTMLADIGLKHGCLNNEFFHAAVRESALLGLEHSMLHLITKAADNNEERTEELMILALLSTCTAGHPRPSATLIHLLKGRYEETRASVVAMRNRPGFEINTRTMDIFRHLEFRRRRLQGTLVSALEGATQSFETDVIKLFIDEDLMSAFGEDTTALQVLPTAARNGADEILVLLFPLCERKEVFTFLCQSVRRNHSVAVNSLLSLFKLPRYRLENLRRDADLYEANEVIAVLDAHLADL